ECCCGMTVSFFNDTAPAEIYPLSLHDALPIWLPGCLHLRRFCSGCGSIGERSEEHTSELQSLTNLVCPLLLEKRTSPPATVATALGLTHSAHAPLPETAA